MINKQKIYPTKKEILAVRVRHNQKIIDTVREWKKKEWLPTTRKKNTSNIDKLEAITKLLKELAVITDKPTIIRYKPKMKSCGYLPSEKTIYLNEHPSILSALHEFAHRTQGKDELTACRWSIWLFKRIFPKAFKELKWDGHRLIKKTK